MGTWWIFGPHEILFLSRSSLELSRNGERLDNSTLFPDILFLMETKNNDEFVLNKTAWMSYSKSFLISPIGLSGGLALLWKDDIEIEVLTSSPNFIDTKVKFKNSMSYITFIYGAPQQENRARFWDHISSLGLNRDAAWLITGDLNDILENDEKVGGPPRCEGSFLSFRNFVLQNGLWNLKHSGNPLSWRGTRYNHFIKARLDRSLTNCSWMEEFPAGRCKYLRFEGSDHRPLLTYFNNADRRRKGLFRFDRSLTEKEEIRILVDEAWNHSPADSVIERMNLCRRKIIEWSKEQSRNSLKLIKEKQNELESALSADTPIQALIDSISLVLEKAYKEEELFWQQRSRIQWLHSGDRNTGYFHAVTRGRRALNNFSVIEDDQGREFFEEDQIASTISSYFQQIFSSNGSTDFRVVEEAIFPKVTQATNEVLISIPDDEEIRRAVFSINPGKAPGPDGFSAKFYQAYWNIIGEEVSQDI